MLFGRNDPFQALFELQRALDSRFRSNWLGGSTAGQGAYPPVNVFQKGEDFVAVVEAPGRDRDPPRAIVGIPEQARAAAPAEAALRARRCVVIPLERGLGEQFELRPGDRGIGRDMTVGTAAILAMADYDVAAGPGNSVAHAAAQAAAGVDFLRPRIHWTLPRPA